MAAHTSARTSPSVVNPVLDAWGEVSEHNEIPRWHGGIPESVVIFYRRLLECDEVLAKHLGPTTPVRNEIRNLIKEHLGRYAYSD